MSARPNDRPNYDRLGSSQFWLLAGQSLNAAALPSLRDRVLLAPAALSVIALVPVFCSSPDQ